MTFSLPIAAGTIATFAAVLGGLAVVAYILKMRRRRFEVPFSTLWQRVLREKETTSLWKHLRRILSLLLQLAILALLLLAVLDPHLGEADADARNVVVIVDTSASMKTRDAAGAQGDADGDTTRMDVARQKTVELLDAMGGGDQVMLMRMDGQTTPLSRFDSDMPMLRRLVRSLEASDTPADLRRALSAAADALRERDNPMIILVGDGAYPEEALGAAVWQPPAAAASPAGDGEATQKRLDAIDLSGVDVRYIPIGSAAENVGIVAFNVRRYITNKMEYEVFIEVQNFGKATARRKLILYDGPSAIDVRELELAPGERLRQIYPNQGGGDSSRLRAMLELAEGPGGSDAFDLDDQAYALMPKRTRQDVLLVTLDNLYLEHAMLAYDNISVAKLLPEEYERAVAAGTLPEYDAVFFDDYTPETLPPAGTNLAYFGPEGEHSPFPIARKLSAPRITELNANHLVTRWLILTDVNFDVASVFDVDAAKGEQWLARSVRSPIAAAKREDGRKVAAFGFGLGGTDLTLRVAFPILLVNVLEWFAGDESDLITTYSTGRRFRVPLDATFTATEVDVDTPGGRSTRAPLVDGKATFYGNSVGFHTVTVREDGTPVYQVELAANLANPAESDIEPSAELILGGQKLTAPEGFEVTHRQSLWRYLVFLVLLLLAIEWFTYNRRITV